MFSGDANAVDAILQTMCFSRDPKLWNVHVLDFEPYKHLCEEPLPLNGSGETPLDIAMKAGHYEEILQVYEALGLPTTIKDQLWLARCTDVMKNIVEKREQAEREKDEIKKRSSLLSDWSSALMDYYEEDINEDVSEFFSCSTYYSWMLLQNQKNQGLLKQYMQPIATIGINRDNIDHLLCLNVLCSHFTPIKS